MSELLNCPFCGGSARISTRIDECIWSHDQVEWTAVSCSGGPDFDCFQPSVDWPTSATDENDTQLSISQWNRRAIPTAEPAEDVRAGALRDAFAAILGPLSEMAGKSTLDITVEWKDGPHKATFKRNLRPQDVRALIPEVNKDA